MAIRPADDAACPTLQPAAFLVVTLGAFMQRRAQADFDHLFRLQVLKAGCRRWKRSMFSNTDLTSW